MKSAISNTEERHQSGNLMQIVFVGFLTFLTISAAALLYANQPEFILGRFSGVSELEYTLFDVMLYSAYLIFGILTGAMSDRWSRRRIFVIIGTSGSIVFYMLMTTATSYVILLCYRFIQGAFTVMVWQSYMTLAVDFSDEKSRGKHMGIFGALLALSFGFGPAVGGMIASYGVLVPYYAAAFLNMMVLILTLLGLKDPHQTKRKPSLMESISLAKRNPKLVIPITFNFVDRFHMGFILTALPLFLTTVLSLPESLRGISLAIFATPFIILQYPMGRLSDKYGRYPLLIAGSLPYGFLLSILGFMGAIGFIPLLVGLIGLGIFSGITAPVALALVGDATEKRDSAMAMGLFNFSGNIGITIGPLILGYLLVVSDFNVSFLFAGIIEIVSLIFIILLLKIKFGESLRRSIQEPTDHIPLESHQ